MKRVKFKVLVPVYNEAANIAQLLQSLLSQKLKIGLLEEIVVVASGCTDETEAIAKHWQKKDKRIRLLRQEQRLGKTAAINFFLEKDKAKLVVMVGGDLVLGANCLENMVKHFRNKGVGMVGARVISRNTDETFLGFANQLIWRLHDRLARDFPRLGEVTAWRRVFKTLAKETICDEAEIEMLIGEKGLYLVYEPKAVVYNQGPLRWQEYLARRRSIHVGHLLVKAGHGQTVESERSWLILSYWLKEMKQDKKRWFWYIGVVLLEILAKGLAKMDYYLGRKEVIWSIATSAKGPIKR